MTSSGVADGTFEPRSVDSTSGGLANPMTRIARATRSNDATRSRFTDCPRDSPFVSSPNGPNRTPGHRVVRRWALPVRAVRTPVGRRPSVGRTSPRSPPIYGVSRDRSNTCGIYGVERRRRIVIKGIIVVGHVLVVAIPPDRTKPTECDRTIPRPSAPADTVIHCLQRSRTRSPRITPGPRSRY